MNRRSNRKSLLLWAGTLAFSVLAIAGPKSYHVNLSEPMKAGNVQLARGEYKVTIEGSNAVFTDVGTRKSLSVPVTIENADKKYNVTALEFTKQGETEQINAIELGGSTTKLEFGQ